MNRLFAALAVAIVFASPAVAQSTDPAVGSGNLVGPMVEDSALGAYAYEPPQNSNDRQGRTVLPYTLQERQAFEAANANIW